MSLSQRLGLFAVAALVHLAALAPLADSGSATLATYFHADAEAVLAGELPYEDRGFEYPPLALPITIAPALAGDSAESYSTAFAWEMIAFDLAIVALLAFVLPGSDRRIVGAVAVYSAGVLLLAGIGPLPGSHLEAAPLPLARFDLAPAALALAAALARERARSATWAALLGLGAGVKAFPALLFPVFARGERAWGRVAGAGGLALCVSVAVVLGLGDDFSAAIAYHSGRELQIESVAATPVLVGELLGSGASTHFGSGSLNVTGGGAEAARAICVILSALAYAWVLWRVWTRQTPVLAAATAVLAVAVVLAPLLSPQFLLWLLPVSAAAHGLRAPNLVLLGALLLTGFVLAYYAGAPEIEARFVVAQGLRNLALVVYAAMVLLPLVGRPEARAPAPMPAESA